MMRLNTFARGIGFAGLAAAGLAVWLVCATPFVGGRHAFALYLVGVTATYLGGLAHTTRGRLAAFVLAGLVGLGLVIVAPGVRELVLGLAVVLAVGRSGFLYQAAPARCVVIEAGLVLGGLAFAAGLGGPSLRAALLAVWGFFLVQSLFFLIPGRRARTAGAGRADPFAAAHARASALLDRGFV